MKRQGRTNIMNDVTKTIRPTGSIDAENRWYDFLNRSLPTAFEVKSSQTLAGVRTGVAGHTAGCCGGLGYFRPELNVGLEVIFGPYQWRAGPKLFLTEVTGRVCGRAGC